MKLLCFNSFAKLKKQKQKQKSKQAFLMLVNLKHWGPRVFLLYCNGKPDQVLPAEPGQDPVSCVTCPSASVSPSVKWGQSQSIIIPASFYALTVIIKLIYVNEILLEA